MKILVLAPQPVYTDRGSPIDVKHVIDALADRGETVDVVTYHLGEDVEAKGCTFHRIPRLPGIHRVRPGFSLNKIICDLFMVVKMLAMVASNQYDLVHAVEEGVFMAMLLKRLFGLPYVYDMDSSMVQQLVDQFQWLRRVRRLLLFFERRAVQEAMAVVPVCPALGDIASSYGQDHISILSDIPIQQALDTHVESEDLIETWDIKRPILLYVGNLAVYQGIDLMLESFAEALRVGADAYLVVVGGNVESIRHYRKVCGKLGISDMVRFVGQRSIRMLSHLLEQADVLLSPRTQGSNTPMKLYSYLASGRPVLATNLMTHTQVVDERTAMLVEPTVESMSAGMIALIRSDELRRDLGKAGLRLSLQYSYGNFRARFNELYDALADRLAAQIMEPLSTPMRRRAQ